MNSTTDLTPRARAVWTPLKAILVGGFLAGLADMSYALIWFSGVKAAPPIKIPQSVAGGLIGRATFDGGVGTAILGLGLHWLIAFIWATIFVIAAVRFLPALARKPIPSGIIYGAWIYFFMNWVVLPLDAMHTKPHIHPLDTWLTGLAVHMFLIGLAISLSAAKTAPQS
jgi:uncharacterized membrane protein YagU involved in acid resistance